METDYKQTPYMGEIEDVITDEEIELCRLRDQQQLHDVIRYLTAEKQREKLDTIVFSLDQSLKRLDRDPHIDFQDMLANNAQSLNAAFDYYLSNAHKAPDPDHKIGLAFRAHAQLVWAINTWARLRDAKNGGTN